MLFLARVRISCAIKFEAEVTLKGSTLRARPWLGRSGKRRWYFDGCCGRGGGGCVLGEDMVDVVGGVGWRRHGTTRSQSLLEAKAPWMKTMVSVPSGLNSS